MINLSDLVISSLIHGQIIHFKVSAWIGGWTNQEDTARVNLIFLDARQMTITLISLGPVLARDRNNITMMLYRERTGTVPFDTRSLKIEVQMTQFGGENNDGCVDNISVVLYQ